MFAKRLKQERLKMGFTQKKLGEILGVTDAAVGMWENGKRIPDAQVLERLADLFDCSVDFLLGRTDIRKPGHFDDLDPETVKILNRARKLTPKAREQLKDAIKWVLELDARERELEKFRKEE